MSEQADEWRRVSSKTLVETPIFTVKENGFVRNGDEKRASFYTVDVPDWINVIAITPENNVVLIEQYRQGVEELVTELPSGMVDMNEAAETAARRELLEETGYEAEEWALLGVTLPNPAFHNNRIHHYLARGAKWIKEPELDDNESVTTTLKSLDEAHQLIREGKMAHSMVVAAFYFFDRLRRKNESSIA
jgi:8-oxo-dGTP pyrophosphatase MutT (NUDIX family)